MSSFVQKRARNSLLATKTMKRLHLFFSRMSRYLNHLNDAKVVNVFDQQLSYSESAVKYGARLRKISKEKNLIVIQCLVINI